MLTEPTIKQDHTRPGQSPASVVTELSISGMTCGNCARHVTEALQKVQGVRSATVTLDARRASVRWDSDPEQKTSELIRAVEDAGYGAKVIHDHAHHHDENKLAGWQLTLWIGVLGTGLLMIGEWVFRLGLTPWFRWFSLVVATVVQVYAGAPFYRGAWNQLKIKSANMDTLVALGSTTAFVYSTWALLATTAEHLYFMEAAAIIALISAGHWLESRVSSRASSALRNLLNLAPERARRRAADGREEEVQVAELHIRDLVVLRPGDRIPTDGLVLEGDSAVDETMLTGESAPVDKKVNSLVYGGTLNINGRLLIEVTATGEDTALAQIIAAVQRAQTSRANIQRLGDRVSNVFVPLVVTVAIGAGLWWGFTPELAQQVHTWLAQFLWPSHSPVGLAAAFIIPAAVLIIACPCAMGLATPAAIMASANAAAKRGILIRDGVALEKAGTITAVLFDKTGTLTSGKPEATLVWDSKNSSAEPYERATQTKIEALSLGAALARHSNHPVSRAVAQLSGVEIDLVNWQEIPGGGVQAMLQGPGQLSRRVRLGSLTWLREQGINLDEMKSHIQEWLTEESSVVGLAIEKSLQGLFAIRDSLKPSSQTVIQRLKQQGFKIYLVTGDNSVTATRIATQLFIKPENVFAEVRPEKKAELVKNLQQQGERVAFVGDGINDAPALEQADLGIAVSRASDIAREAADIILLNSEIEAVPESLGLARATLRTIKQNLFWAFFYNAIGIPLAAFGFMSPILCAAAMGLSDIVVIGNALRLRRWKF
jgi:Cu+-exporting ATPase